MVASTSNKEMDDRGRLDSNRHIQVQRTIWDIRPAFPGHSGLSHTNFTSLAHPADRTLAPESIRRIKTHDHRIDCNDEQERSHSRSLLSQAIFVDER